MVAEVEETDVIVVELLIVVPILISPLTESLDVGFVVPMPRLPEVGRNTKELAPILERPTGLSPALLTKTGYAGPVIEDCADIVAPTFCSLDPSP